MTKEEKELLFKDLCARLPYGVKVQNKSTYTDDGYITVFNSDLMYLIGVRTVKPYLRSMSSMTEEEKIQLIRYAIIGDGHIAGADFVDWVERKNVPSYIDWLNAHHFDYRGLIEKGLAIEAPEGMYNV